MRTVSAYSVTCVPSVQKAMAPESCMVLLNEHPQLKYATTRSVAKHSVGESNIQLFQFLVVWLGVWSEGVVGVLKIILWTLMQC